MHNRPLHITSGRHPFQVGIATAVPVVSLGLLASGGNARTLEALPPLLVTVWLLMLTAGGAGSLVGAYWRGELTTAMMIEFGAMAMLAAMLTLYLLLISAAAGPLALIGSGGLISGMTGAAWVRAAQLLRDWRRLGRAAANPTTTTVTLLTEGNGGGGA